jgi:hypothetical protein
MTLENGIESCCWKMLLEKGIRKWHMQMTLENWKTALDKIIGICCWKMTLEKVWKMTI